MKKCCLKWLSLGLVLLGFAASPLTLHAQYFTIAGDGDLMAGFRKPGSGSNEVVVFLGSVTNFLAMSPGSSLTINNVNGTRLTSAFGSDFTFLQWSVFGANYEIDGPWSTPLGDFPETALWYTIPRTNAAIQSTVPPRAGHNFQAEVGGSITSVDNGADAIGSALPGGTNADNNTVYVREPVQSAYSQNLLTAFISDPTNPTMVLADFGGQAFTYTVENTTPSPFSSTSRSDFYEVAPKSVGGNVFIDPISGSSNSVYWVGYFDLSPTGVLTFTRASATMPPPPAPVLHITRINNTSTISFGTTNGATYSLIYTNTSGLGAPRTNWPTSGSPIIGNGGTTNFTDTTTDPNRVYGVTAH